MAYMINRICPRVCPIHGIIYNQIDEGMECRKCRTKKELERKQAADAEWRAMPVEQKLDWLRERCIENSHHQYLGLTKL